MAGVALLSDAEALCGSGDDNMDLDGRSEALCGSGDDNVDLDGRSGTMWNKAATVATATGTAARQGADAARGQFEAVRQSGPLMREKASKAVVVVGSTARQGVEVAAEGFGTVRQTAPVVRDKVSMAAVAAGTVARHHVEVAKEQFDLVRQSGPARRGKASAAAAGAVAKHRLEVAKGQFEVMRQSGPVIREKASSVAVATGTVARQGVDAAKDRVDAAKEFLVSVRYPGLAKSESVNICNPNQDADESGRLIAMAFARHHFAGVEAEDAEAAAELLRSQRKPATAAGAARLRVKASLKKARTSLRSTKRQVTAFIKKASSHKNVHKQRAAQRAAASVSAGQRLSRNDVPNAPTMEAEAAVTPLDVFELFSDEELALQQALTESMESVEWDATPSDEKQPTTVAFFPEETISELVSVESDELTPEVVTENVDSRVWFLLPSAGTWLLPAPQTLPSTSVAPLTINDDDVSAVPSVEELFSLEHNNVVPLFSGDAEDSKLEPFSEVLASKIAAPTCSSPVQLRSCGGA